jgi:exodeoxyribonuclease VII small subunit
VPEDTTGQKPTSKSFEAGLTELESVVKELESGDLPLERALELFERGVTLSDTCRKQLEEAESRVEILLRKGDKVQAQPFQPE